VCVCETGGLEGVECGIDYDLRWLLDGGDLKAGSLETKVICIEHLMGEMCLLRSSVNQKNAGHDTSRNRLPQKD